MNVYASIHRFGRSVDAIFAAISFAEQREFDTARQVLEAMERDEANESSKDAAAPAFFSACGREGFPNGPLSGAEENGE